MTPAQIVSLIVLSWLVLIALIVALFHGWRWIDNAIDTEMNAIAPAPWGSNRKGER